MALPILRGLLKGYVQSLFDEGIVNDQFNRLHFLKSVEEPDAVLQRIEAYFVDVETILSELTCHVENPDVDFSKSASLAQQIEEKSTSIGAEHVRLACADLLRACDQMHKKNFSQSLTWMKNEFSHTRNKLEAFIQMERRIIRLVNNRLPEYSKMAAAVNHHTFFNLTHLRPTRRTAKRTGSCGHGVTRVRCFDGSTSEKNRVTLRNGNDSLDICRILNGMWQTSGGWGRIDRDDGR
ncbi:Histidine-containing phosphotransfer protein 1-like [Quillaja saponaria]|uniref:Histidine-containing phosphotransfer protein n=1 Tax=Quillaja saponaria TaxID=32244 RepID=A0AAD7VMT4_QUISA|nr:Histidine-containing phosphotransfer protein 1-like [Quillaja saponaria]